MVLNMMKGIFNLIFNPLRVDFLLVYSPSGCTGGYSHNALRAILKIE
jgi:hypothetical protein